MRANLAGEGMNVTTLVMKGNLIIGGGEAPTDCVPTPRFTGDDCYLAPRQHAYTVGEIARHQPGQPIIETKFYGIACTCGSRRTARAPEGERRRDCLDCGKSFVWRVVGGLPVAFAPETAAALEEAHRGF